MAISAAASRPRANSTSNRGKAQPDPRATAIGRVNMASLGGGGFVSGVGRRTPQQKNIIQKKKTTPDKKKT